MDNRLDHDFEVTPERFWKTFLLDEDYERGLYERLRLKVEHKAVEQTGEGETLVVRRELHLNPDRDLPRALAKLIRGATLVKERGHFDAAAGRLDIEVELPVIGKITTFTGRYTWKSTTESSFRRTWEGHCVVHVPLVGRQVERYLVGELESSLAQAYAFTTAWFRDHA